MTIKLLCLDADDTLWYNERHFKSTEAAFCSLMAPFAPEEVVRARLETTGSANVRLYGFGAKGFTLSMIEAALAVAGDRLPAGTVADLVALGRELHDFPLELLDGVADTLALLSAQVRLHLVTKGDIVHQEAKFAASGLGDLFEGVDIVSKKDRSTFERLFQRCDVDPSHAAMVGDSVKSDILPALAAGAWGVLIPPEHVSHHERADQPVHDRRFVRLQRFSDLPDWIAGVSKG